MKNKLMGFITLMLLLTASFMFTNNRQVSAMTLTKTDVDFNISKGIDLYYKDGSNKVDIVIDNVAQSGVTIPKGKTVSLSFEWEMQDVSTVQNGDIFEIPLVSSHFSFLDSSYTDLEANINGVGTKVIGEWKIDNDKILIKFNNEINSNGYTRLENGFFSILSEAKIVSNNGKIEIFDSEVDSVIIEPEEIKYDGMDASIERIYKDGSQINSGSQINWNLFVNYENYRKSFDGNAFTGLNNVVVSDRLPEGIRIANIKDSSGNDLGIKDVEIAMPLYTFTDPHKKMSGAIFDSINMTTQFAKATNSSSESYSAFKARISSLNSPTIGIYVGNGIECDGIVINFGNLPSTTLTYEDKLQYGSNPAIDYNNQQFLIDTIKDLYATGNSNLRQIDVDNDELAKHYYNLMQANGPIAFLVNFRTDIIDTSIETFKNQAEIKYDSTTESSETEIIVQTQGGGVNISNKTIELIKKNKENKRLAGVIFKLQRFENGKFVDYKGKNGKINIKTDKNGIIIFEYLKAGKYRLVEVAALDGYSNSKITYNVANEFYINNDSSKQYIKVIATNYKDKEQEKQGKKSIVKTGTSNNFLPIMLIIVSFMLLKIRKSYYKN